VFPEQFLSGIFDEFIVDSLCTPVISLLIIQPLYTVALWTQ
jgi:hypothetical protein